MNKQHFRYSNITQSTPYSRKHA